MLKGPLPHSNAAAWWTVSLCCLLYIFSFVDRLVLSLLISDIGHELDVTDTQMGLLIGTSFSVVYALAGLPLAHLLDSRNRKHIMVGGVLLWGSMTILSGFASSFTFLAICRAGVALGEAVLTPGAISMFSDLFPSKRRTLPTAFYASMATFMGIGGFIISAGALDLARSLEAGLGLSAWRLTLIFAGMPSVLLGAVFAFTVREPTRGLYDPPAIAGEGEGLPEFFRHLVRNLRFYGPLLVATALLTIFLFGAVAWTPALLTRAYGLTGSEAGYLFGALGGGVGIMGALFWPGFASWLGKRSIGDPLLIVLCLGAGISLSAGFVAPLHGSLTALLCGLAVALFGGAAASMLLPLVIQTYAPARMRASAMAVLMIAQSLIGYGAGPVIVALAARSWPSDANALGHGLSVVALAALPIATLGYFLARRGLRGEARQGERGVGQ